MSGWLLFPAPPEADQWPFWWPVEFSFSMPIGICNIASRKLLFEFKYFNSRARLHITKYKPLWTQTAICLATGTKSLCLIRWLELNICVCVPRPSRESHEFCLFVLPVPSDLKLSSIWVFTCNLILWKYSIAFGVNTTCVDQQVSDWPEHPPMCHSLSATTLCVSAASLSVIHKEI